MNDSDDELFADRLVERANLERRLVRRLDRLAKDWPAGYMLASMGGSLCLFRIDDRFAEGDPIGGLDQEKVLWMDSRIPNTGGDW